MKPAANHPKTNRAFALAGLLASSVAYALALNTRTGKRWADEQTWATVVAGVGLTTAWMAAEDKEHAQRNFVYFAVSGAPIIVRSLWLQLERINRIVDREMR
jgi:hypothetical protein